MKTQALNILQAKVLTFEDFMTRTSRSFASFPKKIFLRKDQKFFTPFIKLILNDNVKKAKENQKVPKNNPLFSKNKKQSEALLFTRAYG